MRQTIACSRCGRQNDPSYKFCGGCGGRLFSGGQQQVSGPQQMYACPRCGQTNIHGAKFCGGCGTPLGGPTQQRVQPAPIYPQQVQGISQQTHVLERKLLFIPKASVSKFIGTGVYRQFYNLVITDSRIIAGRTGIDIVTGVSRALQD